MRLRAPENVSVTLAAAPSALAAALARTVSKHALLATLVVHEISSASGSTEPSYCAGCTTTVG